MEQNGLETVLRRSTPPSARGAAAPAVDIHDKLEGLRGHSGPGPSPPAARSSMRSEHLGQYSNTTRADSSRPCDNSMDAAVRKAIVAAPCWPRLWARSAFPGHWPPKLAGESLRRCIARVFARLGSDRPRRGHRRELAHPHVPQPLRRHPRGRHGSGEDDPDADLLELPPRFRLGHRLLVSSGCAPRLGDGGQVREVPWEVDLGTQKSEAPTTTVSLRKWAPEAAVFVQKRALSAHVGCKVRTTLAPDFGTLLGDPMPTLLRLAGKVHHEFEFVPDPTRDVG